MTQNPISVSPNMNTHQATMTMAKHQVQCLPVVENNKLTGMLSLSDIARKNIHVDEQAMHYLQFKPGTLNSIDKKGVVNTLVLLI